MRPQNCLEATFSPTFLSLFLSLKCDFIVEPNSTRLWSFFRSYSNSTADPGGSIINSGDVDWLILSLFCRGNFDHHLSPVRFSLVPLCRYIRPDTCNRLFRPFGNNPPPIWDNLPACWNSATVLFRMRQIFLRPRCLVFHSFWKPRPGFPVSALFLKDRFNERTFQDCLLAS